MSRGEGMQLVIDTATRRTVMAVGTTEEVVARRVLEAPDRHGAHLLTTLDGLLAEAGMTVADLAAIGVGTGPGSFTGLRVGLAAAKTLAELRQLPLVGIPTDSALRRAAAELGMDRAADAAVVLPAGARDHYLGLPEADPLLVPPGTDLATLIGGRPVLAVDVALDAAWLVPLEDAARAAGRPGPAALGADAAAGLGAAMLDILVERRTSGAVSDVATLVPRYVALPRGIAASTAAAADGTDATIALEVTWSPASR